MRAKPPVLGAIDAELSAGAQSHAPTAQVDMALVRELYGPRKPLLAGNLGGAALLAAVLWDGGPRVDFILWAVLITGVTLMRQALVHRFNSMGPGTNSVAFWTWAYAAGALAGGVMWGATVDLFPTPALGSNDQVYILIIAGLGAAGMSGYAVCPVVFAAFLLPATLPFGWYLFHDGTAFKPITAALFFAWLAAMIVAACWRSHRIAQAIGETEATAERSARAAVERENQRVAGETRARVVAQLSHELRTPLNAIVGFSEAIKHGVFGPVGNPRYSAYADNIHDSGRHLLAVIERALADRALGSEITPLVESDVDLGDIAREACAMFDARARQCAVDLVLAIEEPAPFIRGNGAKLKQALINVISNAVKFTPARGRVVVEVAAPQGENVILRVSDSGVGMDRAELARALDPSLSSPERRHVPTRDAPFTDGRGVGLMITKWLTELHGGTLTLESSKGIGTTVTMQLPRERLLLRIFRSERPAIRAAVAD